MQPSHLDTQLTVREHFQDQNSAGDPRYRIDDRNINSAILAPTHAEKVLLSQEFYKLAGCADKRSVAGELENPQHW